MAGGEQATSMAREEVQKAAVPMPWKKRRPMTDSMLGTRPMRATVGARMTALARHTFLRPHLSPARPMARLKMARAMQYTVLTRPSSVAEQEKVRPMAGRSTATPDCRKGVSSCMASTATMRPLRVRLSSAERDAVEEDAGDEEDEEKREDMTHSPEKAADRARRSAPAGRKTGAVPAKTGGLA